MSIGLWFLGAGKGVLKFAIKHWVWFALAAALLFARHIGAQAEATKRDLAEASRARAVAEANAAAWKDYAAKAQELQEATLAARAQEQATLLSIAKALGATKQGIANAPGADNSFRYSDALYGFMRDGRDRDAAAEAPAVVDGR